MTQNHPYIEHGGANCFRKLRRLIRRLLKATCMAGDARGRTSVSQSALLLTYSFRQCVWFDGRLVHVSS